MQQRSSDVGSVEREMELRPRQNVAHDWPERSATAIVQDADIASALVVRLT